MSEVVAARPRWRDAVVLAVLAVVIIGGLVHYGRGLDGSDRPTAGTAPDRSATPAPSDEPTAQLEGAPATDPAAVPAPSGGTCWDGRETSSLKLCGLPEGTRGLEWVFPSFAADRAKCHRAPADEDSYPVVESYACFQRALGQPVTVTYDQVKDPQDVERWLLARIGKAHRTEVPGAHGGEAIFTDAVNRPARVTGMYERFPYVVSVYAATPEVASRAWHRLVRQRSPDRLRGVRG